MIEVAVGLLGVAALLFALRIARRGSLADRIIALDGLLTVVVTGAALYAALNDTALMLDVLVVVALVGFVGTSIVARYIERRGA
jgi:multicomponent Na+:H+ antiporter subunit F